MKETSAFVTKCEVSEEETESNEKAEDEATMSKDRPPRAFNQSINLKLQSINQRMMTIKRLEMYIACLVISSKRICSIFIEKLGN